MTRYIVQRVLLNLVVIRIAASVVFVTMRVLPGDYAAQQVSDEFFSGSGQNISRVEALKEVRAQLGMNDNVPVQYVKWWWSIARGDFGKSFLTHESAIGITVRALPYTVQLGFMMLVIALLIAVPVGTISALRQDSLVDGVCRVLAILGLAAPSFWTASVLTLLVLRFHLWQLNVVGHPGIWEDPWASLELFILPALAGGFAIGAILMRFLRSQLLDVLRQDYVRTARAKGLQERGVVLSHVLRNALIPVITVFGVLMGVMVGGSVILEQMFGIPGMGSRLLRAILVRDVPVAQAMTLVIAAALVMITLLIDLSYFVLDPRVTVSGGKS